MLFHTFCVIYNVKELDSLCLTWPKFQKTVWTCDRVFLCQIYIYAFSRRFYPKRLTLHSGYTFFCLYVCSLGIEPTTFCAANAMLYHWATGTLLPNTLLLGSYKFLKVFFEHGSSWSHEGRNSLFGHFSWKRKHIDQSERKSSPSTSSAALHRT